MNDSTPHSIERIALQALSLMDLTSLTNNENDSDIMALCKQAQSQKGNTAAICIYPRFIPLAKKILRQQGSPEIKVATVTNFPHGNNDISIAVAETKAAVAYGADEVDVVFPYKALIAGDINVGFDLVEACKQTCPKGVLLKVIIETGELKSEKLIKLASEICIKAGADFIKTSTGKVAINATPEAAEIMLKAIQSNNTNVGFKAAGGVKNAEDAKVYLDKASSILGNEWVNLHHFRFGASSLLDNLLSTLSGNDPQTNTNDPQAY